MEVDTILKFLTVLFGLYMAWNIGANDVANAMGTSVGSKALTLKKAVIIAAIFEFSGAYFVGSHVSETIQKGIVSPEIFSHDPMIFVIGMVGALVSTGAWLQVASYFGLPVSTTHAIVGAILGFGTVIGGVYAVAWSEVLAIASSWVLSPILSGIISYFIFSILQRKILYAQSPALAAKKLAPILIFFCFSFFTLSILFDGLSNLHLNLSFPIATLYSMAIGLVAAVISSLLMRKLKVESIDQEGLYHPQQLTSLEKALKHLRRVNLSTDENHQGQIDDLKQKVDALKEEVKAKTHYVETTSQYREVEKIFVYLQIISASLVAFAHGANDVANAIGPVAAVINVLQTKSLALETIIPNWLLLMGGAGIVVGLATWGWRVIETIGRKITALTPTRGFSAEFGAATTILLASKIGLPISTTHALVGSVLGVGLARGIQALNLKTLRDVAVSWIVTIPACALMSLFFFYILRAIF